jgi:hypothetical protein
VLDTIETILEATNGTTSFGKVYRGEPPALPPGGPYAAFWFTGEVEKAKTFGNVMVDHEFQVACYWPFSPEETVYTPRELEIWNACRDLQTAFRADSQLGGNCEDLEIGLAQAGVTTFKSGAEYRALMFTLQVKNLNEEAISA